jgi:hypothetical protein
MTCAQCGKPVPVDAAVKINGDPVHVECFGPALKAALAPLRRSMLEDLTIDCEGLPPMTAYKLGQQSIGVLVSKRRRERKP